MGIIVFANPDVTVMPPEQGNVAGNLEIRQPSQHRSKVAPSRGRFSGAIRIFPWVEI